MARLPQRHQTLLFSATMPREIEALAQAYLTHPITVKVRGRTGGLGGSAGPASRGVPRRQSKNEGARCRRR